MDRDGQSPWNPRIPVEITPVAFEELVLSWIRCCGESTNIPMDSTHLGVVRGAGREYKIDVLVKMTVFEGAKLVVLVECKHHKRPVEREDVMVLEAKIRDVGAHKGMLFSTSGFQQGAIQYAEAHGIATIAVVDGRWLYQTKSAEGTPETPPPWAEVDRLAGIRMTATATSVHCHTIEMTRLEAIREWVVQNAKTHVR